MGSSILFVPLSETWNQPCSIPFKAFCNVFAHFGIAVGDFEDGSHSFSFCTPTGSSFTLHDEGSLSIEGGNVTGLGIDRPCSPNGRELWLELLNIGFVMIPDNGPVFAIPAMARRISYLDEMSADLGGVHIVERVEDFSPFQGPPVARKPEPVDWAAVRTSIRNSMTPMERGFSLREWLDSSYGSNWDKSMSVVTNVIVSITCLHEEEEGCWPRVNTFFPEGRGLVSINDAKLPDGWCGGNRGFEASIAIGAFNYFDMKGFITHLESLNWHGPASVQIIYRAHEEHQFVTINVLDMDGSRMDARER